MQGQFRGNPVCMSFKCGSKLRFPYRIHGKGRACTLLKEKPHRAWNLKYSSFKAAMKVASLVCHNLNTARHVDTIFFLPSFLGKLRSNLSTHSRTIICVAKHVNGGKQVMKQIWCAFNLSLSPTNQWYERTTSTSNTFNFTLFLLQRPRAAHSLWAHLLTRAQQSARGGICGDQTATFGAHARSSDETFTPSATTASWSCWRYSKGQTALIL